MVRAIFTAVALAILFSLVFSALFSEFNPRYVTYTRTDFLTRTITFTLEKTVTVDLSPPSKVIIFRLDDVSPGLLVNVVKEIIKTFVAKNIPLTVAIVPNSNGVLIRDDAELVSFLKTVAKNSGLIEIAQHGWNHTNYPPNGEFKGRPYEEQLFYMMKGKEILEEVFSNVTGPVQTFTVTYNVYDENTVRAAKNIGYKIFSSKLKMGWWDHDVTPPALHNKFNDGILFLDWNFPLVKNDTANEFHTPKEVLEGCRVNIALHGLCVVLFHVQDLDPTWSGSIDRERLRKLVDILDKLVEAREFNFMTMRSYYQYRLKE